MTARIPRGAVALLAVLIASAASTDARAGMVKIKFKNSTSTTQNFYGKTDPDGQNPDPDEDIPPSNLSTRAGVYQWQALTKPADFDEKFYNTYAEGSAFQTFCVELDQNISYGGTYNYEVVNLDEVPVPGDLLEISPMGLDKAKYIRELFGRHFEADFFNVPFEGSPTIAQSKIKAAAFQTAIWEIVTEELLDWDVTSANGRFYATGTGSAQVAARDLAQQWLNELKLLAANDFGGLEQNAALDGYDLYGLKSLGKQDQIVLLKDPNDPQVLVPGPASAILFALGGIGLLFPRTLRRKRKRFASIREETTLS